MTSANRYTGLLLIAALVGCRTNAATSHNDAGQDNTIVDSGGARVKPADPSGQSGSTDQAKPKLAKFASPAAFDNFMLDVKKAWQERQKRLRRRTKAKGVGGLPMPDNAPTATTAAPEPNTDKETVGDESITNNQEAGVDEGDIVKAIGDFFVVLRRGRLFSIRHADAAKPVLTPAGRCNAYPKGAVGRGTWYDEMLAYRDQLIVIGYNYRAGGTEIGLFRLGDDGSITHEATHYLRSNDYYSSRNYASRLVGSKLIFYMPFYLRFYGKLKELPLPAVRSWQQERKRVGKWNQILSKVDVYRPLQRTLSPTLHTVVQCDLSRPSFDCRARGVIGPYSRSFYVSSDAIYVWVTPQQWGWQGPMPERPKKNRSYVYRMPILGDGVTAIRASGSPIDQFSFKQSADGHLNVLLTDRGSGDWMFSAEAGDRGKMAMLRVPLSAFSDMPEAAAARHYTALPKPTKGYSLQNRFVGDWLLWSAGAHYWAPKANNGGQLFVTNIKRPAAVTRLELDHGVERIEALGRNAVAVGSGKQDLFFSSVALGVNRPAVVNTWVRNNAAQGESRSHGFFFLPTGSDGSGMLGLPVRTRGRPHRHLVHGSAEVLFLSVSSALRFAPIGALQAHSRSIQDNCVASCVDWYGNARPIFFRGRIFALLGYELVEGSLFGAALQERTRTHFLHPRRSNAAQPFLR